MMLPPRPRHSLEPSVTAVLGRRCRLRLDCGRLLALRQIGRSSAFGLAVRIAVCSANRDRRRAREIDPPRERRRSRRARVSLAGGHGLSSAGPAERLRTRTDEPSQTGPEAVFGPQDASVLLCECVRERRAGEQATSDQDLAETTPRALLFGERRREIVPADQAGLHQNGAELTPPGLCRIHGSLIDRRKTTMKRISSSRLCSFARALSRDIEPCSHEPRA